ncbi:MAG: hypothetical protein KKC37_09875 [Proteobacteria bacterium]|nr:hypothetical protein [Pseudomonadota bacterium]
MSKIAVIDVGSYTVRLLVAQVQTPGLGWRPDFYDRRVTNLGRGLDQGRGLDPAAVRDTEAAVAAMAGRARDAGAEVILPVGTAAVRRAVESGSEGREVVDRLSRAAENPLNILSGPEEARLSVSGVVTALDPQERPWLVFDLGGRSLEVAALPPRAGSDPLTRSETFSLELGALSLTERFVTLDPPPPDQLAALRAYVARTLAESLLNPGGGGGDAAASLAGTGGTVSTLGVIEAGLSRYEVGAVGGLWLARDRVGHWLDVLSVLTEAERRRVLGPAADRALVIVAGAAIVQGLIEHWQAPGLRVVEAGLLEGVVEDYLTGRG